MNRMPSQPLSDSTDRQPAPPSTQLSSRLPSQIRMLFTTRVVETISVALVLSLLLFGVSSWNIWTTYRGFKETVTKQFRLQQLSDRTTYLDEVLTMSAYMAASTGDLKWVDRYRRFEPELIQVIDQVIQASPTAKTDFNQTKTANDKLVEYETRSFELLRQGEKQKAKALLFGKDYATQKQIYAQGVERTLNNLQTATDAQLQSYTQRLLWSVIFTGISLPLLLLNGVIILSSIRTYIRQRNSAQEELLASQSSLLQLNEEMKQRAQQIATQEQVARQESEVLQVDVSNLLDVVSAVEEGDLTVQAPVSDRVTGLVADTFNRLLEQLSSVMAQVLGTAQQVTIGSLKLEELAKTVATNAQQQAYSVTQVLGLTEQVEHSAQASAQKVHLANQSLENIQDAIARGQVAIDTLIQGIAVLQQGTERIVQQMKALGEFVGVADSFVQEQGQIASITEVLAMNAGLIAARAAEQRDPRQFSVVAREFEAIAKQVATLAQQTNGSLDALQQRTEQIHTVVSAIDIDIQGLSGLIGEFTQGVEQSSHVFNNVRTVTGEVVQAGVAVAQSNLEIVSVAQSTATTMRGIADLAAQTAQLTQNTRLQSEQMETLSAQLLQRVQFFRLPTEIIQSSVEATPVDRFQSRDTIDVTSTVAT